MTETERLLIDNLERHRAGDAATANLIADAAATIRCLTAERDALHKHADALAEVLGDCADDLQVEVCNRYAPLDGYETYDRKKCGELVPVIKARSTLAAYTAYLIDGENG